MPTAEERLAKLEQEIAGLNGEKVSLREHLESRIDGLEEMLKMRFDIQREALAKASETLNTHLEGMNEFRSSMKDQAGQFVTRDTLKALLDPLQKIIGELQLSRANWEGRMAVLAGILSVGVSIVVGLVMKLVLR